MKIGYRSIDLETLNALTPTTLEAIQRKRQERRFARARQCFAVYRMSLIGMIYWNMNGVIMDANCKFLEMVGYMRQDLAAGMDDYISKPVKMDELAVALAKIQGIWRSRST